jgi:diguanylate cyclase (GGDEF)-like protein
MISLKKYLDSAQSNRVAVDLPDAGDILPATMTAYRSALLEMGNCSLEACAGQGAELKHSLDELEDRLSLAMNCAAVEATDRCVQEQLQDWGRRTARHYRQQTGEVKTLLLVMARTAESVGERDQRCAQQIGAITGRLKKIANLEDLTQIRASIVNSAAELKSSIDKMAAEGEAAIRQMRAEVSTYQAKLEEAEHMASRDALTGLRNRTSVESQIESRIGAAVPFCVAILDLNGFKKVNDEHGHLVGDEVLKQFAGELQSACRSTDILGRWGGDEFILLLDCGMAEAKAQIDRLREWVCGDYVLQGRSSPTKLRVDAAIGLAEHGLNEPIKELLDRADAEMYRNKAVSRTGAACQKR